MKLRIVVAAAVLAGVGAPAGVAAPAAVWRIPGGVATLNGPAWYTASLFVPERAAFTIDIRWIAPPGFTGTACAAVIRRPGVPEAYVANSWAVVRDDHVAAAVRASDEAPPLAVDRTFRSNRPEGGWSRCAWDALGAGGYAGLVHVALFAAWDRGGPSPARLQVRPRGGARILAESSGRAVRLYRERDFAGIARASATRRVQTDEVRGGAAALVMAGRSRTAVFRRSPVAYFSTAATGYTPYAVGTWRGNVPGLLSITGPDRLGGIGDGRTTFFVDGIGFASIPGTYRFTVELLASPLVAASVSNHYVGRTEGIGKTPWAVLASADADFPACTTRPRRVVARAADGHPVCAG